MKTKLFNAWTELLEKFLKNISNEIVSYDELSTWMDTDGLKIFQGSQGEYFEKNKTRYSQDADVYPPPVRIDLAYEQIAYGFDKLFEKLVDQFSALKNDCTNKQYAIFKKECLGETFLPFIAARAVITGQLVKLNEPNRLKNLENTIKAFEFLEFASKKSIESMNEFLPKVQSTISRGPSSPLLHKEKQEAVTIGNSNLTHDDSMVLKK